MSTTNSLSSFPSMTSPAARRITSAILGSSSPRSSLTDAADGKVFRRPLGLGAVVGIFGHLHLAHRVSFDAVSSCGHSLALSRLSFSDFMLICPVVFWPLAKGKKQNCCLPPVAL